MSGQGAGRRTRSGLHAWVFLQHQVWVDYWGNEHEIESMPADYAANVIDFCTHQAPTIRLLVALSTAAEGLAILRAGSADEARRLLDLSLAAEGDPIEWLENTPLLRALRRRLVAASGRGETSAGTDAEEGAEA